MDMPEVVFTQAKWISDKRSTCQHGKSAVPLVFQKVMRLRGEIKRAEVFCTALGVYELEIDGQKVGEDYFAPGFTSYRHQIQVQRYDVTMLLHPDSALRATVAGGWAVGSFNYNRKSRIAADRPSLLLELHIDYADGTAERIGTDETWRVTAGGPVRAAEWYDGESFDATISLENARWHRADIVKPRGKPKLLAQYGPPVRVYRIMKPISVTKAESDEWIYDFGQNFAGVIAAKINGKTGQKVVFRHAELLSGGELYTGSLRTAKQLISYTCRGGEQTYSPRFTYMGFHYVGVTGIEPERLELTARALSSELTETGRFECSNPLLNRLNENIKWSARSNLMDIPTDCPQRDERLGWMGDALVFGPTSCWNMQMAAFYTKWLRDVRDTRDPKGGWVTDVAPAVVVTNPAAPGWGDAAVATPWYVYEYYGDSRILEQCYDMVVGWVEYMHAHREEKTGLYERKGYGDWVATVESPTHTIGAAYYYYSTRLASRMAAVLGKKDDAEKYVKRADEIAAQFNKAFLNADTSSYPGGTQTANLLPLHFGIVPDDRQAAVLRNILDDIKKRDFHLSTGFLGTAYLMTALADFGQQEVAYRLATQTTCPSWGYMLRQGATTMWERWDTDKWGPDMNSRNHYAFGAVARWMFETLGGINLDPAAPGFKRIIIRPRPAGDLIWAGASYASVHGPVSSQWRRTANELTLDVIIPANTAARVHVPTLGRKNVTVTEGGTPVFADGKAAGTVPGVTFKSVEDTSIVFEVGSGQYKFEMQGR